MHGLRDIKRMNDHAARAKPASVERDLRKLSTDIVVESENVLAVLVQVQNGVDLAVMDLHWLRKNYASAPTAEINARIDAALARLAD